MMTPNWNDLADMAKLMDSALRAFSFALPSLQSRGRVMRDTDLDHLKKGAAILAACVVQTLNESDPSFQGRFLDRLTKAYRELKDDTDGPVQQEMELLAWTRTLLTGFSPIAGQGKPFLED